MVRSNKLWRILIFPRTVFGELRENTQAGLPFGLLLASVFASALIILFLFPIPVPSAEEAEEYRIRLALLHEEAIGEDDFETRRKELREEYYGPQGIPNVLRIGSYPLDPLLKPFGVLCLLLLLATAYKLVTKLAKTEIAWEKWFGFSCWAMIPLVFDGAVDVVYAAMNMHKHYLIHGQLGAVSFHVTSTTVFWFWAFFIEVQGLRAWTSRGTLACIGMALLAFAVLTVTMPFVVYLLWSVQAPLIH